jgi:pyruvate/2-oxoglutarate/acetoin dehydrogenase E1 component
LNELLKGDFQMKMISYSAAISEAIAEEMRKDPKVVVTGLEQGFNGAAFGQTRGLFKEFGADRVLDMPLSEAGYTGMAVGAAATGLRMVTEIQFCDWMTIASDQLVNQAAFMRYMYGGSIQVPLTIRTTCGGYNAAAAQHSKMMESWFAFVPGLKVAAPSTPFDAKALLKASIRDNNPVIFFEHKKLFECVGDVSENPDDIILLGKAEIKKEGRDVSIITYSYMVQLALKAADFLEKEGICVEVVDLRSIKPIDREAILASAAKTGKVLCLQETWLTCSVMSEIAAVIAENLAGSIKALRRLGAKEAPVPFSPRLEQYILPGVDSIIDAVHDLCR